MNESFTGQFFACSRIADDSAPLFLCVFVIGVVKLVQLNEGGVVKTESDSELDDVPGRTVTSS